MNIGDILGIAGQTAVRMEEAQARGRAAQLDQMRLEEARRAQREAEAMRLAPLTRQVGVAPTFAFAGAPQYMPTEATPTPPAPVAAPVAQAPAPAPTPQRTIQGGLNPLPGGYGAGVASSEGELTPFERPMRLGKPPTPPKIKAPAKPAAPPPPIAPTAPATPATPTPPPPEAPVPPAQMMQFGLGAPIEERAKNISPSEVFAVNPQAVGVELQNAMRKREELTRLAQFYQKAGLGDAYGRAVDEIEQTDKNMYYLQGMQGITELEQMNNPNRLAAVMSSYVGQPVAYRVRQDGTLDQYVNGQLVGSGLSRDDVVQGARTMFDETYRQTMSARLNEEFKAGLKLREEIVKNYLGGERDKVKLNLASVLRTQQIADELKAAGILESVKARYKKDKITAQQLTDGRVLLVGGNSMAIWEPNPEAVTPEGVAAGVTPTQLTVIPNVLEQTIGE